MKPKLLEILTCPKCHQNLSCTNPVYQDDELKSGTITCPQNHSFKILDFIPAFTDEPKYVKAFDFISNSKWCALSGPEDRELVRSLTIDEFRRQTGFEPYELKGKRVLDAGCGLGRFISGLSEAGAEVVGVDALQVGLQRTHRRLNKDSNIHLIQADLFHLPFKENCFDFIYSLGVLHHTPDPPAFFKNLVRYLKKDGTIAIWVYPKPSLFFLSDWIRPLTTRLPLTLLSWLGTVITGFCGLLIKVPSSRLKSLMRSALYRTRLPWHEQANWRMHSFMDWYGPPYQFKYSNEEVCGWFENAGLSNIQVMPYETAVRGTKNALGNPIVAISLDNANKSKKIKNNES